MPEMTAEQAIEKLKTLKPEDQKLVLSRLTPEKREGIARVAFTANPKGEGLYRMLPASDQGFTRGEDELQVPFSKVAHAQSAGYNLHPDESSRYKKDFSHPGEGPTFRERATAKLDQLLTPEPNTGVKAARVDINNTARAAGRVVAGLPQYITQVVGAASDFMTGKSQGNELMDLLDPSKLPEGLYNQFQQDWKTDKRLAVQNLIGSLIGLGLVHKATGAAREGVGKVAGTLPKSEIVRQGIRENLGVAEHTKGLVTDFGKASEGVRKQHQAAQEQTFMAQGKVDEANKKAQEALDAKNEKNRKDTNEANLKQLKEEAAARLKALKQNRAATQEREGKPVDHDPGELARVKAENERNLRREKMRQKLEGQHIDASKRLDQKFKGAFKKAKSAYDATWNKWRDMVKGQMAPMKSVVDTIKAQEASMNPQQQSIFRDILQETQPSPEEMTDFERDRDALIKGLGYKAKYDDLPPKRKKDIDTQMIAAGYTNLNDVAVAEVPASRLHGWKSQLEKAVRNTSDGVVRYAVGKVLQQVRTLEGDVSANVPGAKDQLTKARAITGPYFDAFFKSPEDLPKEAGRSLREQSPEYAKQKAEEERLKRIAAYDPSITGAAKHVENLQAALKNIPKPKAFQELPPKPVHVPKPQPKPLKEFTPETREPTRYGEPEANAPLAEVPDLKDENVKFINERLRKFGQWGSWVLRLIAGGVAVHVAHGNMSVLSGDLLIGQTAVTLLTNALRKPSVLDWLAEPSKEDLEMINTLPPQDAVRMREALGALSREEIRQNPKLAKTKIAPSMAAFLAGQAASQQTPQKYQQTATGPNGHKIGSNDSGNTWYDVETGKQVK
jgi:hypothetical protein